MATSDRWSDPAETARTVGPIPVFGGTAYGDAAGLRWCRGGRCPYRPSGGASASRASNGDAICLTSFVVRHQRLRRRGVHVRGPRVPWIEHAERPLPARPRWPSQVILPRQRRVALDRERGPLGPIKPLTQSALSPQGVRNTFIKARSLPSTVDGITAGQRHYWPSKRRSGSPRNGTRRTDRLIHLQAGQVMVTCPVGPPPFSAGMTLQLETYTAPWWKANPRSTTHCGI